MPTCPAVSAKPPRTWLIEGQARRHEPTLNCYTPCSFQKVSCTNYVLWASRTVLPLPGSAHWGPKAYVKVTWLRVAKLRGEPRSSDSQPHVPQGRIRIPPLEQLFWKVPPLLDPSAVGKGSTRASESPVVTLSHTHQLCLLGQRRQSSHSVRQSLAAAAPQRSSHLAGRKQTVTAAPRFPDPIDWSPGFHALYF